ncbi:MAG: hypothetical protein ACJ8F1_00470 [Polyangia bacterium]
MNAASEAGVAAFTEVAAAISTATVIEKWRRDGTESIVNQITGNLDKAYRWFNVCEGMISVIGSLVMGTFAWGLFWATISLGGQRTSSPPKR